MSGPLLTAEELAARWQVKTGWVYAKTHSGEIPKAPLPGRYFRYRLDVIERFEAGEGGQAPTKEDAPRPSTRIRRADLAFGAPTRPASRSEREAPRASRPRGASCPNRIGIP